MSTVSDDKYILSIDPGLRFAGWTVFDSCGKIVESDTIKFNTKLSQCVRLQILYSTLIAVSKKYTLSDVITEFQFVEIMSTIVGVIMAFTGSVKDARFNKTVPMAWKKAVTGRGNIEENLLRDILIDKYPEAICFDEHQLDTIGLYLAYKENQLNPTAKKEKKKKVKVERHEKTTKPKKSETKLNEKKK